MDVYLCRFDFVDVYLIFYQRDYLICRFDFPVNKCVKTVGSFIFIKSTSFIDIDKLILLTFLDGCYVVFMF